MKNNKNCVPQLLMIYLLWGFNWVVIRTANNYFPPILFVALRFTIGALALLVLCAFRKKLLPPKEYLPWIAITGLLTMAVNNVMVQFATIPLGSGMTSVIDYTMPLWTTLFAAVALGEKLTVRKLAGTVVAIVGLAVLMNVSIQGNFKWAMITVGAAMIWAVSNILVKAKLKGCDMIQYTAWQMAFAAIALDVFVLAFPQGDVDWQPLAWGTLLYNGLLASSIAFFIWNYVLTNMEAGKASVAMMAVPAVGVLSGILVLGEPMTPGRAIGMIAIIVGILIVLTGKDSSATKTPKDLNS